MNENMSRVEKPMSQFDMVRKIEAMKAEVPYAVKQLKEKIAEFRSASKKLSSLKSKALKKSSAKMIDKVDACEEEFKAIKNGCVKSFVEINRTLDEISTLYSKLSEIYLNSGKRKEAKRTSREADKFSDSYKSVMQGFEEALSITAEELEKESAKAPEAKAESRNQREYTRFEDREARAGARRMQNEREYRQTTAPHYPPHYPNEHYYMPPHPAYYQPYQPMPSFNIAPISIDVSAAVDSAMDSFVKMFEDRIGEYLDSYELPEINVKAPEKKDNGEALVLEKALEDESFALEKLTALLEKIKTLLTNIGELSEACSLIEEKNGAIAEAMKNASDAQKLISRELQGVQATQKVISGDQIKLAEEQAIIAEQQKLAMNQQLEIASVEKTVLEEIDSFAVAIVEGAEEIKEALKDRSAITKAYEEIVQSGEKFLELQNNLTERQSELTELQREALSAHKKLVRSQKAVNERVGAAKKTKPQKEEAEDKSELPSIEETTPVATEGLEAETETTVPTDTEIETVTETAPAAEEILPIEAEWATV